MLFILYTVPVSFSADSKLTRNSVLLLPETLDIQVVTRESESGKSARKMVRNFVSKVWRQSLFGCAFLIVPPASLTPYGHSKMGVICPHHSAGSMCIMWVNLVQVSPSQMVCSRSND